MPVKKEKNRDSLELRVQITLSKYKEVEHSSKEMYRRRFHGKENELIAPFWIVRYEWNVRRAGGVHKIVEEEVDRRMENVSQTSKAQLSHSPASYKP